MRTLWMAMIFGIPSLVVFHWGLETWGRNPSSMVARRLAAMHGVSLMLLFSVFATQVLPPAADREVAVWVVGTLGSLLVVTGLALYIALIDLPWDGPRQGLGAVALVWILPVLAEAILHRNLFNVSHFYRTRFWTEPVYNARFHVAMIIGVLITSALVALLVQRYLTSKHPNQRAKLFGLIVGTALLDVANLALGVALPTRAPAWMPPYPYIAGMLAWLVASRYAVTRHHLIPVGSSHDGGPFARNPVPLLIVDPAGMILEYNAAALSLVGWRPRHLEDIFVPDAVATSVREMLALFDGQTGTRHWELEVRSVDASPRYVSVDADVVTSGAQPRLLLAMHDRTREQLERVQLTRLAYFDTVTGLPNRVEFRNRLTRVLHAARDPVAVLLIDLDNFKAINDTHGHNVGDTVLRLVGQRIDTLLRPEDCIARLAGDEFVAFVRTGPEEIPGIVGRILDAVRIPLLIGPDRELEITVSIGVAVYPRDGTTPDQLIRVADEAMYTIKRSGKNHFAISASGFRPGSVPVDS